MRHDLAVVVVSVCRASLIRAVSSIFMQKTSAKIQVLVGIDQDPEDQSRYMEQFLRELCPEHVELLWLSPGYSTSSRHGGPHSCGFGGSLRTVLSFLADAEYVMYLDDDDWLTPSHCQDLLSVIGDKDWAYAYSLYCDGNSAKVLCVDALESVGVDRGVFKTRFGGFVRPSGLMLHKLRLSHILHLWSISPYDQGPGQGAGEDRLIFNQLKQHPYACSEKATVCYALDPRDMMHEARARFMRHQGVEHAWSEKQGSVR